MQRRSDGTAGRLLLALAVALHRSVAGEPARERWQLRRNAALRAAYRRGVPGGVGAPGPQWEEAAGRRGSGVGGYA
jgi:hypothetical protein